MTRWWAPVGVLDGSDQPAVWAMTRGEPDRPRGGRRVRRWEGAEMIEGSSGPLIRSDRLPFRLPPPVAHD